MERQGIRTVIAITARGPANGASPRGGPETVKDGLGQAVGPSLGVGRHRRSITGFGRGEAPLVTPLGRPFRGGLLTEGSLGQGA